MTGSKILPIIMTLPAWLAVSPAPADNIKPDDIIIPGHLCVGTDCSTATDAGGNILLDFETNTLIFRENNLRVRLVDSSASDALGQSWSIAANDTQNGGRDYFQFEAKSLTKDTNGISNGSSPMYDCSVATNGTLPPIIGTIPSGSEILFPVNPTADGMGMFLWSCDPVPDFTVKPLLSMGDAGESSVTLGIDSQPVVNAVSVGNPGLLRNLKRVATGLSDSELMIKKMLDDYSLLPTKTAQIDLLMVQLTMLEDQIADIEDEVFDNGGDNGGGSSKGGGSFDWGIGLLIMIWLTVNRGISPNRLRTPGLLRNNNAYFGRPAAIAGII